MGVNGEHDRSQSEGGTEEQPHLSSLHRQIVAARPHVSWEGASAPAQLTAAA